MPRASLIIRISKDGISYEGNEDIVWFLKEKSKKNRLSEILRNLVKYKEIRGKKHKMNIILIGIRDKDKKTLKKFEKEFNFIIESSYQTKIIKFLK